VYPSAPKVPKKVKLVGSIKPGSPIKGTDVRVFDAETGELFAECQAISMSLSIDDEMTKGDMLYINFAATEDAGDVVEETAQVEIVSIDIQPIKQVI
jgi:hypothetical protein